MESTSAEQSAAVAAGRLPAPEEVRPDVWSIPIAMASAYVPYTLTAVIRDAAGGLHVIDPGVDSDANWAAFGEGLESFGLSVDDVATVTSTHVHPDHVGLAHRLRERSGAALVLHRVEQQTLRERSIERDPEVLAERLVSWGASIELTGAAVQAQREGLPAPIVFEADRLLDDGDQLDIPGRRITVLHTPGHTAGSICLRFAGDKLLFTGDHVLPTINPGIGLGGTHPNPLADYLAGLERVAVYDDDEVWPGHFFRFRGIAERSAEIAQHQLKRATEVRAVLDREPDATVWNIAQQLTWTNGWAGLTGFLRISALMQTEMFVEYVR